jgi:hypothetical protein
MKITWYGLGVILSNLALENIGKVNNVPGNAGGPKIPLGRHNYMILDQIERCSLDQKYSIVVPYNPPVSQCPKVKGQDHSSVTYGFARI